LRDEGCRRLLIANRSQSKARRIVDDLKAAEAVELPGLVDALSEADVVVTSTGATHFVVRPENVRQAMAARPERPLFVVDIAVPRDVDPDVAGIPNVTLVDIDALKGVINTTLEQRREEIPLVEEIIAEHTKRYADWYQSRITVPVVASLVEKAEAIRRARKLARKKAQREGLIVDRRKKKPLDGRGPGSRPGMFNNSGPPRF